MRKLFFLSLAMLFTFSANTFSEELKTDSLSANILDEVVVSATRTGAYSPIAHNNVSGKTLNKSGAAVNIPILLNQLTSVVAYSEDGTGVGASSFRIRGTDDTRINVTLNNMPLNNPESQGVFWVNLPNLSSSVKNIQLQRGIGSSTNGSGAFGATISIRTNGGNSDIYGEASSAVGSYGTFQSSIAAGTGILPSGISIDARYSRSLGNGYIRNGKIDHHNFYGAISHYSERQLVQLIYMKGIQHTGITWEGVTRSDIEKYGRRYNPAGKYTDEAGNTLYYQNETDNYFSDIAQMLYTRQLSSQFSLNANFSYNHGFGYYENFKEDSKFSKYGFAPQKIATNNTTTTYKKSDLIRQKLMKNDFYVANISAHYKGVNLRVEAGGMYSYYHGLHYGVLPWVKYNQNIDPTTHWYDNSGTKSEWSAFAKAEYDIMPNLTLFLDLQGRFVNYLLAGNDDDGLSINGDNRYNFINPKAGIFYKLNDQNTLYSSVAMSNREPLRADLKEVQKVGSKSSIKPERMIDYELGYKFNKNGIVANANLYYMDYKNQMVQTGKLTEVGYKLMENVDRSSRAGVELEFGVPIISNKLRVDANATFSRNIINDYTAYFDIYDDNWSVVGQKSVQLKNSTISFSPSVISSAIVSYSPLNNLSFALLGKYVGKQYLDNTTDNDKSIPDYFTANFSASYTLHTKSLGKVVLDLYLNNIFNSEYIANGYASTSYFSSAPNEPSHYVGLYPQATRNFMLRTTIKF